jgi:hypothetical protein
VTLWRGILWLIFESTRTFEILTPSLLNMIDVQTRNLELLSRKLPTIMHHLMLTKVVTRSFQLRHVSMAVTTIIRESFYTASWNAAGIKESPPSYAHAAKVRFTPFVHIKHVRH